MQATCRALTRETGEPLVGSAATAAAFVAIAWPKPRWHPDDATRSDGLPARLREIEVREKRAGRKLPIRVFQRATGAATDRVEMLFYSRASERFTCEEGVPVDETPDRIERFLSGDQPGRATGQPLLLVCTDGRHDRCCATHGRAMAEALRMQVRSRSSPVQIAESSHLGGHRFAATCIALPHGHMYGRLEPDDAPALVESAETGSVLVARYRGAVGFPEPHQVAEAYVRARFPDASELAFTDPVYRDGSLTVTLRFHENGAAHALDLQLAQRPFTTPTSCNAHPDTTPRPRWVLKTARPPS